MSPLNTVILLLIFALFLLLTTTPNESRFGRLMRNVGFLFIVLAATTIGTFVSLDKENRNSATVPQLNHVTNGLYEVLGTYKNVNGTTLAILHPARITHIDVTERGVASVRFGSPQLLAIDYPIASPQPTNSVFVEIIGEGKSRLIQTFRPFPSVQ